MKAIRGDEEEVALQAVEFWSTLCDYELELEEEGEDAEEVGGGGADFSDFGGAARPLAPLGGWATAAGDGEECPTGCGGAKQPVTHS